MNYTLDNKEKINDKDGKEKETKEIKAYKNIKENNTINVNINSHLRRNMNMNINLNDNNNSKTNYNNNNNIVFKKKI